MRIRSGPVLLLILLASSMSAVCAQETPQWTDWGGGYLRGPDSASTTVATSGGGTPPATVSIPPAPVEAPKTDWGGGYLRGPDSASTTVATSGAGGTKP